MDERYLEMLKILSSKRRANVFVRELSMEQIENIISTLQEASAARIEQLEVEQQELEAKQAKIDEYIQLMKLDGIDVSDLISGDGATAGADKPYSPRVKREPKYEYVREDGQVAQWTGQGRTPKAIVAELERGKTLEDFLIIKE